MATEGSAAMGESGDSSFVNVDAPTPDNEADNADELWSDFQFFLNQKL